MAFLRGVGMACLLGTCLSIPLQYNETEASLYMQYARSSFCTRQSLQTWDCGDMCDDTAVVPGSVQFFEDDATQMQGYVAQLSSTECIAAFRGSVTVTNYLYDFDARLQDWPKDNVSWCSGCKVHTGVAESYNAIRLAMTSSIMSLKCRVVNFAGHSLGGGIVALASLDVRARLGLQVDRVYTYGMLRVGNQEFINAYLSASKVSAPMWRIVHYKDPVPRLPFVAMGYVHIPTEVYYTDKLSMHWKACTSFTDQHPEDKSCSWATDIVWCIPPFADPTFNHNMYMNKTTEGSKLPVKCLKSDAEVKVAV